MSTGSFKKLPICCPMCGEQFTHPRGLAHCSSQGHGSGEFEVVCKACGFDGGVATIAEPRPNVPANRPTWCPMCGHQAVWTPGDHWGLACMCDVMCRMEDAANVPDQPRLVVCTCRWIGRLHDYRSGDIA